MKRSGAARVLVAIGFVVVILLGVNAVLGLKPSDEPDPTRNGSATGYSLLRRFLQRLGYAPQLRHDPKALWKAGALVFFDYPDWDEDGWDAYYEWLEAGGAALCLGGADGQWYDGLSYGPGAGERVKSAKAAEAAPRLDFEYSGYVFKGIPEDSEALAAAGAEPVLARLPYDNGSIVFGADSRLFDNETMRSGGEEYAVLVNEIFKPAYRKPVYFYSKGESQGQVSDPIQALFRGRFLPFTLQALAACLALALAAGMRFGSPLVWNGRVRRASLEHVNAVGRFLLRAGAAGEADEANAAFFRNALRSVLRSGSEASDASIAEAAAQRLSLGARRAIHDESALAGLMIGHSKISDREMRRRSNARAAILEALERSSA
jgi:hypothetical protein